MLRLRFLPKAVADIESIHNYIATDNPAAADRVVDRIRARCLSIVKNPLAFRTRTDLGPALRQATVGLYLVFFTVDDANVTIVRVLHGARKLSGLF